MVLEKALAKIRGKRAELGLSQTKMAQHLGLSLTAYASKEKGKVQFTLAEVIMLCHIFKCNISDIFLDTNVSK